MLLDYPKIKFYIKISLLCPKLKNTKLPLFIYAREEINGQTICRNSVYRPRKAQAFFCKTMFIVTLVENELFLVGFMLLDL